MLCTCIGYCSALPLVKIKDKKHSNSDSVIIASHVITALWWTLKILHSRFTF